MASRAPLSRDAGMSPAPAADQGRVPDVVVEQAVGWFVRLASGTQTSEDEAAFALWHAANPDHAAAWRQLQGVSGSLRGCSAQLAPAVVRGTLTRLPQAGRRRALGVLAVVAGGAALPLLHGPLTEAGPIAIALADHRTATGEVRDLTLPDGTRLQLNTSTAANVRFDANERLIELVDGEILVSTAKTRDPRPLRVRTRDGVLTPVGTRFAVRRDGNGLLSHGDTYLAVTEGAVDIRPAAAQPAGDAGTKPTRVAAGHFVRFDRHRMGTVMPLDDTSLSWAEGVFTAAGTRLADLAAELGRYRPGVLRVDPAVADLRMTGAWRLQGTEPTERILAALERHLPVRIHRRTRYWVVIGPA